MATRKRARLTKKYTLTAMFASLPNIAFIKYAGTRMPDSSTLYKGITKRTTKSINDKISIARTRREVIFIGRFVEESFCKTISLFFKTYRRIENTSTKRNKAI